MARHFGTIFLIVSSISACSLNPDRPISDDDRVFGTHRAGETVLRLKSPCAVPSDTDAVYILPAGDYAPESADNQGIYYKVPRSAEVVRGDQSVWIWGVGIHFPSARQSAARPSIWIEGVDLERGSVSRVKRWPLPPQCWQPYGATLAIVHKAVEVSPRR